MYHITLGEIGGKTHFQESADCADIDRYMKEKYDADLFCDGVYIPNDTAGENGERLYVEIDMTEANAPEPETFGEYNRDYISEKLRKAQDILQFHLTLSNSPPQVTGQFAQNVKESVQYAQKQLQIILDHMDAIDRAEQRKAS